MSRLCTEVKIPIILGFLWRLGDNSVDVVRQTLLYDYLFRRERATTAQRILDTQATSRDARASLASKPHGEELLSPSHDIEVWWVSESWLARLGRPKHALTTVIASNRRRAVHWQRD